MGRSAAPAVFAGADVRERAVQRVDMSSGPRWHIFGLACALSLSEAAAHAGPDAPAPAAQRATPPGAKVSGGQLLADDKAFVAGPEGATLELIEGATLRLDPG